MAAANLCGEITPGMPAIPAAAAAISLLPPLLLALPPPCSLPSGSWPGLNWCCRCRQPRYKRKPATNAPASWGKVQDTAAAGKEPVRHALLMTAWAPSASARGSCHNKMQAYLGLSRLRQSQCLLLPQCSSRRWCSRVGVVGGRRLLGVAGRPCLGPGLGMAGKSLAGQCKAAAGTQQLHQCRQGSDCTGPQKKGCPCSRWIGAGFKLS